MSDKPQVGAQLVAESLQALNVSVVFGIVGIPIVEIAEACIALGIRFIAFRNEQAASYAASAYGYLTGRPGVLLVVGGPGVIHALAGIHGAQKNYWPLLVLCGSPTSSHISTKGSFQSLSAAAYLGPQTKLAIKPPKVDELPTSIFQCYATAFWGRSGATCVEIPGDFVTGTSSRNVSILGKGVADAPKTYADAGKVARAAGLINSARRPLVVIGKGAAYARCEELVKELVEKTGHPFLPTPMGKGVVSDEHHLNASAARSFALKNADVVLVLGARLNWILHFGEPPKWSKNVKFIRVDISAEEIPINLPFGSGQEDVGLVGDCGAVVSQLLPHLRKSNTSSWVAELERAKQVNTAKAAAKLNTPVPDSKPLTYERVFELVSKNLKQIAGNSLDPLVLVAEGANTMDKSRSIFEVSKPRQRLDAGTDATMGVGLGYAIAAWEAYNSPTSVSNEGRKKIVALEGDSAFGFSGMEVETMARYKMDILIFVINNGGVYHGEKYSENGAVKESDLWAQDSRRSQALLPPTALSHRTGYDVLAKGLGAEGYTVKTEEELVEATKKGFNADGPVVINVWIASGGGGKLEFAWQKTEQDAEKSKL